MTRIQYEHHAEQMEAYRAEFYAWWNPVKSAFKKSHPDKKREIAMLELREWNRWYNERKHDPQTMA